MFQFITGDWLWVALKIDKLELSLVWESIHIILSKALKQKTFEKLKFYEW